MSYEAPFAELAKAVREFLVTAENHGQILDLVSFGSVACFLKLLDRRMKTHYYEDIIETLLTLSRSAPCKFDTYILRAIKYVSEGLQWRAQIVQMGRKKTPVMEA